MRALTLVMVALLALPVHAQDAPATPEAAVAADDAQSCDPYLKGEWHALQQPAWFACTEDADCEAGEDPCHAPIAVNVKQHAAQKHFVDCVTPRMSCAVGKLPYELVPACLGKRCQMTIKK